MKRLLLPLLAAFALPTAVNANWFSGDIVEKNAVGEKTIIKNSTVVVTTERVKDLISKQIYQRDKFEKLKINKQELLKKTEEDYTVCLSKERKSSCDRWFLKYISAVREDINEYQEDIQRVDNRIKELTPIIKKLNQEEIVFIKVNYTPIFENINGFKVVQNSKTVTCENQSLDFNTLNLKRNYSFNSLERKVCQRYAKF